MTNNRKQCLLKWLYRQSSFKAEKCQPIGAWTTRFFRKPYYRLMVYRHDGQHWNPWKGRTLEGAIGGLLRAHRLVIDSAGRESNRDE